MVYWLVQLASLTMVLVSNVRWQGSKIKQCRLVSGGMICEIYGAVYTDVQLFSIHHRY